MADRRIYNTKTYRANRLIILQGNPQCAICHVRKATTVDHIVEVDRGGDNGLSNMQPACQRCNSAKGAQYGNAKRRSTKAARQEAIKRAAPPFFGGGG